MMNYFVSYFDLCLDQTVQKFVNEEDLERIKCDSFKEAVHIFKREVAK